MKQFKQINIQTVHRIFQKNYPKKFIKKITDISYNQGIFDAAKTTYKQKLRSSGFNEELKYKNKIVRNKLGMKKRGIEEGILCGLIHSFL